ncbi:MAG: exodeoxyribonuclease VII large subunit, partial [Gammaproteobacteria bacterium]
GIINSPTGAALHDITVTLSRRFPLADVVRYPVMVQGEAACQQIADALDKANNEQRCNVLILARGGGSLEDLWALNEEMVARAISRSKIPVVVGVGHETDVTLADYAADYRAATPTAAAEAVTPDAAEIFRNLSTLRDQMDEAMAYRFRVDAQRIDSTTRRLRHPRERLQQQLERVRNCRQKLRDQQFNQLSQSHSELNHTLLRLTYCSPLQKINLLSQGLEQRKNEIKRQLTLRSRTALWQVEQLNEKLNTLSPSATLGRGFAIITSSQDGSIVRSAEQLKPGQAVTAQFARGGAVARIEKLKETT